MNRPVVVLLLVSLGVGLGIALVLSSPEPDERQAIEWLDTPRSLGSFSLETEAGGFDRQSLMGHWTIVLFGFLHCPDICPTSLSQLATLANRLAEASVDPEVAFVFVSVDPARDSVTEIGQYVRHFSASIQGATGAEDQLAQFAGDLGIQFSAAADSDEYAVAHSVTFSIIDPAGVFCGRFRPGFDTPDLVSGITSKLAEARI